MKPKLLITGASGFIGSYVMPLLKGSEFEVLAPTHNELDLMNQNKVTAYIYTNRPTHLLHLAWVVSPGVYKESLDNLLWVDTSEHLFYEFIKLGGTHILGVGTDQEYDPSRRYFLEDYTPERPASLYGIAKLNMKNLLSDICEKEDCAWTWARVFNIYGYGEPSSKLISTIIRQLDSGKPAMITTPNSVMDYINVKDVARILVALISNDSSNADNCNGITNVCTGQPVSIKEIAEYIGKKMGCQNLIQINSMAKATMSVGNNAKLKRLMPNPIIYNLHQEIDGIIELMRRDIV